MGFDKAESTTTMQTIRLYPDHVDVRTESSAADPATTQVPGLILETWRDAWTYCKATKRVVARFSWVPWLTGITALISAATGTTVFATMQANQVSTLSRVVIGTVAVGTALISALQVWTARRIAALNEQAHKFHEFHRKVEADLRNPALSLSVEYANEIEEAMRGITAGMSEPSNSAWAAAKREMRQDMLETCPDLCPREWRESFGLRYG
jgi:hypothetical protein